VRVVVSIIAITVQKKSIKFQKFYISNVTIVNPDMVFLMVNAKNVPKTAKYVRAINYVKFVKLDIKLMRIRSVSGLKYRFVTKKATMEKLAYNVKRSFIQLFRIQNANFVRILFLIVLIVS